MPCYNEEACIATVLNEWAEVIRSTVERFEMIVVNDGSSDESGLILDRLCAEVPELRVIHQENAGHGVALRRCLEESCGKFVFHVDSDNQFVATEFKTLWDLRDKFDYLTGIRRQRHDAFHRLVITRILRWMTYLMFGVRIYDANTPFKLMNRRVLDDLLELVPSTVFAPSIFMTVAAAKNYRFVELPVTHLARTTGTVSIVRWRLLKACLRCCWELARFRRALQQASPSTH